MASPETIDQKTNRSYLESGLQPSVGRITPIRNVQVEKKFDPKERRGGKQANKASGVSMQVAGASMQVVGKGTSAAGEAIAKAGDSLSSTRYGKAVGTQLSTAGTSVSNMGKSVNQVGRTMDRTGRRVSKGSLAKSFATSSVARAKATTVNTSIWAWGVPAWLFFQLPLALLSLAFLMAAALVDEITKLVDPKKDDGWIVSSLKTAVGAVGDFASWVVGGVGTVLEGVFGFDPTVVDFDGFFVALWLIVMMFGLFILMAIYLIYKLALLEPLSGNGSGAKHGAFLIAFIGYSLPVLNLVPWFIFWTIAVWRYPK